MQTLIESIHALDSQFVLAISGGGSTAISALLSVPGASNTVIESRLPYSYSALSDFLGVATQSATSNKTARAMAMVAYQRAKALGHSKSADDLFGLGCTAALATHRSRRGADRCLVAIQSHQLTFEASLTLDKSWHRQQQEAACCQLIIESMACVMQLLECPSNAATHITITTAPQDWQDLMRGLSRHSTIAQPPRLLFPGAFNPPHAGHGQMQRIAEQITGLSVTFEISIDNVDKPPLDFFEMQQRQKWLEDQPLIFTHAPTFIEKSRLFPEVIFVVGVDTMIRIADPKYYANNLYQRDRMIAELIEHGHRFLVFGRLTRSAYQTLSQIELPDRLRRLCDQVTEAQFRADIASTVLRAKDKT